MNYATNIALVDRATNIVTNIIWGMIYQMDEFNTAKYLSVQIDNLPVQIGDSYDGANFYHEGEKVLSRDEEIADMQAALHLLGVNI